MHSEASVSRQKSGDSVSLLLLDLGLGLRAIQNRLVRGRSRPLAQKSIHARVLNAVEGAGGGVDA
jgi:hypothetical protein